MASHIRALMASALRIYDELIGGGVGTAISIIVKHHIHLRGINFDLSHVIASAPTIMEHMGGNMFEQMPLTDAVFVKLILHDWDDEHCMRILNKCREVIPVNGKIILVNVVVE
eukprot:Gb_23935 [translate_table: standard]